MKICIQKVEKRDIHQVNAFHLTPRRSGKKGNLNRIEISNYNKTFFQSVGVSLHKGKCPAESKVCNKCKKDIIQQLLYKVLQNRINAKSDNHKDNSIQNPHSGPTQNRITHSPSVSQEHESKFDDEVYSDNDEYLLADKDLSNLI